MEELQTTLSHYRIVSKLGAGGMGEVYLAQDTKLDRKVALKILPADVAANKNRMDRFVREAKAAAALNHPNIAHVYEIGECDGTHFIAMEYIDGETLREKIHRDRTPLPKLLKYLNQVAEGLAKAHNAGIVHRDLKPDNVMITRDDYAKVLDFGLAKLIEGQEDAETGRRGDPGSGGDEDPTIALSPRRPVSPSLSTPGIVMGTVGYMSPEQASGRIDEIDHRSDIFSFGCILFEAATGKRAFEGKDALDSLHKIVHAPTPQLKDVNPLAPYELQRVVRRCLAKEPEKRYQSIKELAIELDDLQEELKGLTASNYSASQASPTIQTTSGASRSDEGFWVAVLPFKVRDDDPAVATLADGLSEEIVTGLSRFRYLSVVTSASAARLTGDSEAERAKLGTRYVLDGSIRKGGSTIRVSAQLVDTETRAQLWSETYNRDLQTSTIFGVQDDVAARIVATAADSYGVLVHSMRDAIRLKDDADLTPAEWQFQYFAYREQITPSNHAALKIRLERAAKSDNRPSELWACLAQVYLDEYAFGFPGDDGTSLDRALVAARRAVELDRANQFAMVALAQTHFFRQDLAAFGPAAERAMALNPLNTDALGILGLQIVHTGEFERGTTIVRRAMELNPNHAGWMHFAPLWDHFHKGEYEQALECANRVDVPGLFWPYLVMASACGHLGRRTEAEAAVRDLLALDPEFAKHARSNVGTWHFASGLMDPILEGLRKAGLDISDEASASTASIRSPASSETRADEGFWVAVLPFKFTGSNTDVATLAEGLSEEIVTGLSRFSYLRVISRGSTLRYASETDDVRVVGKTLGARYVMEGSLRLAGSMLRVAVQLVDASTGVHFWAETYDRPFRAEDIFAAQDDLAPRIVSTVADQYGALVHSMSESLRGRSAGQYSAHEAVLRAFGYWERMTPEEHAEVRDILEAAVAVAPDHSDCLAELAFIYWHEYAFGYNLRPDPLGRARAAAQRAVASAPTSHFAHCALATGLFFQKDYLAFRSAAERALALNRMDSSTAAILGNMIAYAGDWEYGLGIVERAMQLNPHHAGWYHYVAFCDAYRKRDYRGALASALKVNMPAYHWPHVYLAAVYGQLGEQERARAALRELDTLVPNFGARAREEFGKWLDAELTEHLLDGLRKAGLEIADEDRPADTSPALHASSETRADEGFWIAVLPFKFTASNVEVATLAEGLSDEIVTGLSRFSYLRVISRSSTLRYAKETDDVRDVGKRLGARYVMEGSLRVAGSSLRISVQLLDAGTGAHLWAETYDRQFRAEEVFALQDDLVPRIVSTVADVNGVLPRSMSEVVCGKNPNELSPYEAVLRSFRYFDRVSPEELAAAQSCLELAVEKAPTYGDAWAMLALLRVQDYAQGFNLQSDSLKQGRAAAQRAVEAAPSNHLAYFSLAQAHFFQKELQSFRNAAERAVALNPMDGNSLAFVGELLTYVGDSELGLALATRAKQINPNHPGWFWYADFFHAYRQGDYSGALSLVLKANLPGHWGMHAGIAACAGQLGEREMATKAIRDLLKLQPHFGSTVNNTLAKWFDPELCEQLLDGLRKAGLEIAAEEPAAETTDTAQRNAAPKTITVPSFESRPAIAVLPFDNLSADPEQEYFADGLAEDLITRLSLWRSFPVIARNSSFVYKGRAVDLKKVSAELGVRYVVQGSVRKANNQVRISAQLVDSTTGQNVWAKTYDRELTDVFGVQDEISEAIAASLVGDLERSEHTRVQRSAPENLEAWGLYQSALPLIYKFTREDCAQARTLLARAVEHDPHFATALARLAEVGVWEVLYEWTDDSERTLDASIAEARRAVALDPLDAQARIALSFALMTAGDGSGAREEARHAVELNPSMPFALAVHAHQHHKVGHSPEESIDFVQRALRLSPHDPVEWLFYDVLSGAYFDAGRFEEGLEASRRLIALSPNYYWGYLWSAMNAVGLGEIEQAHNLVREALRVKPELTFELATKCLGTMAPDVDRRFKDALRKAGLEIAAYKSTSSSTAKSEATSATTEGGDEEREETNATPSIAVLPFVNISNERENEYFCDGLAEELLNALSKIESLHVAARTSAFSFKGKQTDVREIGSTLSVSTVLEGSVRRSGNRMRISVQLVNVADGYHLWSEKYDRQLEDIFDIQDEISLAIVAALKVKLLGAEQKVVKRYTENTEAYQLYLKGRFFVNQRTSESLLKAIEYFNKAIALDANYALGYAGLADAYLVLGVPDAVTEALAPRESLSKARAAAEKALQLDTSGGEVYAALAHIKWKERDWAGAESDYKRSIELNPNNPIAHFYYAVCLAGLGRKQQAIKEITRAQELDPLSLPVNASVVYVLYLCGKYDEAIEAGKRTLELDAAFPLTHQRLGLPYIQRKMYREAISEFQQAVNNSSRAPQPLVSLAHAYAVSGNNVKAQEVLDELKDLSKERYVSPYGIAIIHVGLEDKQQALQWLERAYDEQNTELTFLSVDPRLDPLRDDPGFQALLKKVGFPRY